MAIKKNEAPSTTVEKKGPPKGARKHLSVPRYAPFWTYENVVLKRKSYRARDLLNLAAVAFHERRDGDLRERQIAARRGFIAVFKKRKAYYGRPPKSLTSLEILRDDVQTLAKQLDSFFFFGALMKHVRLRSGINVVGKDPLGIDQKLHGETFACRERQKEYIQININLGTNTALYKLSTIVGLVVHEMVHAYFQAFACDCARCSNDVLNTVGLEDDGHGPLFLMLHRLIVSELRSWGNSADGGHYDSDLKKFLLEDCPGKEVSRSARARAQAAKTLAGKQGKLKEKNSERPTDSRRYVHIRLSMDSAEVTVEPEFMFNQMWTEKKLRRSWKRSSEREEDVRQKQSEDEDEGDEDEEWGEERETNSEGEREEASEEVEESEAYSQDWD